MADVNPVNNHGGASAIAGVKKGHVPLEQKALTESDQRSDVALSKVDVSKDELTTSVRKVEAALNAASKDTSLSFSVEKDLKRMVVSVRAVGSDEIIRQFPPEEFITVAKHIAAQNPDMMDEDYLKGILFDQYS